MIISKYEETYEFVANILAVLKNVQILCEFQSTEKCSRIDDSQE